MMSNLFSIFDSSTNNFIELNWSSSYLISFLIPSNFWFLKSRMFYFFHTMLNKLNSEFKIILLNKYNFLNSLYLSSMLIIIFFNNLMGLFPYIFTSSSHLIFSLTLSIPLWLSLFMFSWINNTNFMFSHLIPQGTPNILMPFMVLIESISNVIRPATLSIRLTANMIAGHLLITLLSNSALSLTSSKYSFMVIIIQITLLTLEFSVSMIQAYVFAILVTLYIKETN